MMNPLDERWWRSGSALNWYDSTLPPARWMPAREEADRACANRLDEVLRALALIHEFRTIETSQLHALDPTLPAHARAKLYMAMVGSGLIDMGYPLPDGGRIGVTPATAPFMAVRLPVHAQIGGRLEELGANPVQIHALGLPPLRGSRQYDRHNLICSALAVRARALGWRAYGEMYGRFSLLTGDPMMGNGGPDLSLVGEHGTVCIELTASANQTLASKFRRWDEVLDHPGATRVQVVWLDAWRTSPMIGQLETLCSSRPLQHAAPAKSWLDGPFSCTDGFAPEPGRPPAPRDWMRADLDRLAKGYGFPDADGWRLPEALSGSWPS